MAKKQKKQPKKVQHKTVEIAPKPKFDIKNFIFNQIASVGFKKLLDSFDWDTFTAFIASIVS